MSMFGRMFGAFSRTASQSTSTQKDDAKSTVEVEDTPNVEEGTISPEIDSKEKNPPESSLTLPKTRPSAKSAYI